MMVKILEEQVKINEERARAEKEKEEEKKKKETEFKEVLSPMLAELYERAVAILKITAKKEYAQISENSGGGVHFISVEFWKVPEISASVGETIFRPYMQSEPHQTMGSGLVPEKFKEKFKTLEFITLSRVALGAKGLEKTIILSKYSEHCKIVNREIDEYIFKQEGSVPTVQDIQEFFELLGLVEAVKSLAGKEG